MPESYSSIFSSTRPNLANINMGQDVLVNEMMRIENILYVRVRQRMNIRSFILSASIQDRPQLDRRHLTLAQKGPLPIPMMPTRTLFGNKWQTRYNDAFGAGFARLDL
jgi:hypothetical protein